VEGFAKKGKGYRFGEAVSNVSVKIEGDAAENEEGHLRRNPATVAKTLGLHARSGRRQPLISVTSSMSRRTSAFPFAIGRVRIVPQPGEVRRERTNSRACVGIDGDAIRLSLPFIGVLRVADLLQGAIPVGFQSVRDEPIRGIDVEPRRPQEI